MEPESSLPKSQVPATFPLSWASFDPAHTPTHHFLKIHLNIILPSTPGSPRWSLPAYDIKIKLQLIILLLPDYEAT